MDSGSTKEPYPKCTRSCVDALRYKHIVTQTAVGVAAINTGGEILTTNPAWHEIFEMTLKEYGPGIMLSRLTPESRRTVEIEMRKREQGIASIFEIQYQSPSGMKKIRVASSPTRNEEGALTGHVNTVTDITREHDLEQKLFQAQKMEAVGHICQGLSHDLGNILTVVNGNLEMILADNTLSQETMTSVQEAVQGARRANTLVEQLLEFSRQKSTTPSELCLNEIVRESESMLRAIVGGKHAFAIEYGADLGLVESTRAEVEQIMYNLVINASHAMIAPGTIELRTANAVVLDPGTTLPVPIGPYVTLSVSDTGDGIPSTILGQIYEPFFTTKKDKGTGLGLSIIRSIIERAHGGIAVHTGENGTQFTVYLPRKTETVLIVEDDTVVGKMAEHALIKAGYRAIRAQSADEAYNLSKYLPHVDALLTDSGLPGGVMSAADLSRRLQNERGTRVVVMSASPHDEVEKTGVLEHAFAYVQKPFGSPETISSIVEDALATG